MKKIFIYHTSIGKIAIAEEDGKIIEIHSNIKEESISKEYEVKETTVIKQTYKQLQEYFEGKRKQFSLPLAPKGTLFQQKVWKELQNIPYGETRTYQEIAQKLGNPKACRAVGMANHNNPIGIVIPCHRVIGKNGKLTGYAGGLEMKEKLLKIEQKNANLYT